MNGMPFRFCTGFKISFTYKYVRDGGGGGGGGVSKW